MEITCPFCGYTDREQDFDLSMADEAFCPRCDRVFVIEWDDPEDEEDE